ncbi:RidA family protein [Rhizobium sp. 3T7]|uniref:RidA family protein n=1 Tax=Rhizobium sp. 3T7 TaxID=2874922 RepID=UPI001CCED11B|nr:RidA family protein [Rhizobium sp. 3T7]MBZ9793999.1 RidA family protein [Rhizobium sp. 3T7]
MAIIEQRLTAMGLELPAPLRVREGLRMPFAWVRVRGNRAYISGHVACNRDGTLAKPLGKVGADVSPEQGYASARLVALAHLASLKRAVGDLDRGRGSGRGRTAMTFTHSCGRDLTCRRPGRGMRWTCSWH